jgi:hypothetical protein
MKKEPSFIRGASGNRAGEDSFARESSEDENVKTQENNNPDEVLLEGIINMSSGSIHRQKL